MSTKTATSLSRKLFLAFAIGTTGLLVGCSTCYNCQKDCPYGYDTSTPLYDKLVFGWMPDFLTLRSSGNGNEHTSPTHYHSVSDDHVVTEAEGETFVVPAPDTPTGALSPVPDDAGN